MNGFRHSNGNSSGNKNFKHKQSSEEAKILEVNNEESNSNSEYEDNSNSSLPRKSALSDLTAKSAAATGSSPNQGGIM